MLCLKMVVSSPLDQSKFNVELGTFLSQKSLHYFIVKVKQIRLLKIAN